MKPRNFVINIILIILALAQMILSIVSTSIPWGFMFIGLAGIILTIADCFLKVKHKAVYIVFKSIFIFLFSSLVIATLFISIIVNLIFGIATGIAEGCGGSVSVSNLDMFVINYYFAVVVVYLTKVGMLITDLAVYKKDKKQLLSDVE